MAIDERKIMNGTHGTVFLDGEEVAELKAFCWESFGVITPMGNSVSFPTKQ